MSDLLETLIRVLPPLIGSLLGVLAGFGLDRRVEKRQRKENLLQRLKSIKRELERNRNIAQGNYNVIADLQERETNSDHYALSLFEKSAWETAVGDQLVEELDSEFYSDLHEVYSRTKSLNEQIKRLRTEAIHPSIGEVDQDEPLNLRTWTITVKYWDEKEGAVESTGLGDLIQQRSKELRLDIDEVSHNIEDTMEELREELNSTTTDASSIPRYSLPK